MIIDDSGKAIVWLHSETWQEEMDYGLTLVAKYEHLSDQYDDLATEFEVTVSLM